MGDDGGDVDAGVEEVGHLVPGLVHLAAVDAFDGDHIEDDGLPVDAELLGGNAEEGDLAAVEHIREHILERLRNAGHFHADVEAFLHPEIFLDVFDRGLADIDGLCDVTHFLGELEAERVNVGDDNVAGTGVFRDRGGHNADRAGSGDEHVFAEHFEFESGVDGVAERIEDRGDVEVDLGLVLPNIGLWDGDELGEPAVRVYANPTGISAKGTLAGHAVSAASANQVTFDADNVTGCEVQHIRPYIYDLTNKFVADRRRHLDRLLCPRVPIINMQVRTADAPAFNAYHHVVDAHFRLGNILDPEARFSFALYDGFH